MRSVLGRLLALAFLVHGSNATIIRNIKARTSCSRFNLRFLILLFLNFFQVLKGLSAADAATPTSAKPCSPKPNAPLEAVTASRATITTGKKTAVYPVSYTRTQSQLLFFPLFIKFVRNLF